MVFGRKNVAEGTCDSARLVHAARKADFGKGFFLVVALVFVLAVPLCVFVQVAYTVSPLVENGVSHAPTLVKTNDGAALHAVGLVALILAAGAGVAAAALGWRHDAHPFRKE